MKYKTVSSSCSYSAWITVIVVIIIIAAAVIMSWLNKRIELNWTEEIIDFLFTCSFKGGGAWLLRIYKLKHNQHVWKDGISEVFCDDGDPWTFYQAPQVLFVLFSNSLSVVLFSIIALKYSVAEFVKLFLICWKFDTLYLIVFTVFSHVV